MCTTQMNGMKLDVLLSNIVWHIYILNALTFLHSMVLLLFFKLARNPNLLGSEPQIFVYTVFIVFGFKKQAH